MAVMMDGPMAVGSAVSSRQTTGPAATIRALLAADGSAAAPYAGLLASPAAMLRDLADAVYALCVVHGSAPGVVDHALARAGDREALAWLTGAADAMRAERAYLARLTAAVGPLPSTPGHAAAEAAIIGQRQALAMLASSDRAGCGTGAALALVLDWETVRTVLDGCAARLGIEGGRAFAPVVQAADAFLDAVDAAPGVERALAFGAQQVLAQHRGLWALLESRAAAREPN
ncbi:MULTISPECIES: DUF6975 family protein [Sphingomonas]|jgi:hypothetical protein|uniref:DUF6975 family protein n=1 Tax=Sphingomonas TaxID=13687 RepID=UPI000A81663A|nr:MULTISPECIES: hypothetical protein [Sphingomonas]